ALRGGPEPTPEQVEFFEKKIRPVLTENCYGCHSAEAASKKKLKGGLQLDTRDGLLAGGDSGKAIVPGKPADSTLIRCLKYTGDVKMPPKGKLPDAVIADFEKWVAMGAPDPRQASPGRQPGGKALDIESGRKFWAYKRPIAPAVPAVNASDWPVNEIDRYVLARLEAAGLKPAPDADRAALARRLYFDLIGLPPSPEEVDAFVRDPDPAAYEKLVDRLLADPRYGERWGRHWLDVVRYADSVTLRGFVFKEAWRYRDYVIDAFNRDMPYPQFIREQIAGDLLPATTKEDRTRQLVATTYLQLGNTNLEEQDKKQLRMDVVDEQLDVIGKGLLAQTITCARCHDHKFDPIPTKDYYALAGIFRNVRALEDANVSKWIEVPLPAEPEVEAEVKKYDAAVAALQARIKAAKEKAPKEPVLAAKGVLAVKDVPGIVVDDTQAMKVGEWMDSTYSGTYIGTGYTHDKDAGKGQKTITFQPELPASGKYEVWLAYSPGSNRADKVPVKVFSADGEKDFTIDMKAAPPIEGRFVSLGQFRFEKDGQSFVLIANEGTKGHVTPDAVTFIPAEKVPTATTKGNEKPKAGTEDVAALEAELKKLQANPPKRPMAMSVVEEAKIEEIRVHVRGSVHSLGEPAPRGFLQVASAGPVPAMPKDQSGRVQLADWIASPENPLTARVFVNRAWHWLFGSGIVRTVDNFGTTGELPSHPELLDHLALAFVKDGWSVKKLVRSIVLSHTYRQSAACDARTLKDDPENKLFGRANLRRLDAECIRDTILTVSGKLTTERGGPMFPQSLAADYGFKHTATGRSVYLPVFRNSLPEAFEAFDFADPSTVTGRRNTSTVAPQALFMMNNPFVIEQARHAAARLLAENLPDDYARITRAYRRTLGREPTAGERAVAAKFLADKSRTPRDSWAALFHALFASADFRYVD
ncbi:MAG TPA: DUF1553 domain-containing protein, partial [Gemmataceae bacterium]|nr:DUF1553 domain-containing protein [Gemmataceae bacterium]